MARKFTAEPEVVTEETVKAPTKPAIKTFVVTAERLNVRAKASADAPIIDVLTKGTEIKVNPEDQRAGFYNIGKGFVMAAFTEEKK